MFELNAFAREVNQNAVEHGWWEKERGAAEIRALIHSEWSEALEEERAGRPLVWHWCKDEGLGPTICEMQPNCTCKLDAWETDCPAYDQKPEGGAVELIDGCIRILDYIAHKEWLDTGVSVESCRGIGRRECAQACGKLAENMTMAETVDLLHLFTALARSEEIELYWLKAAMGLAFEWVAGKGLNPETIIQQKHRYNKTRPYKHGKRF